MSQNQALWDIGGYSVAVDRDGAYKVLIVGAGSGIGKAAAEALAAQGADVLCADNNQVSAKETADRISALGGKATALLLDLTNDTDTKSILRTVIEERNGIHALVNCAGVTGVTNLKAHEVDIGDFDAVYRVNLRGALSLTQAVLPSMLAQGYGRILHVASIAGKEGNAGMAAYSATKAGLIGLVKSMAKDFAESGVTINALTPAVIRTPMVEALPQSTVTYMTEKIPMKRCGTLTEVAAMIGWIVSPACSFTTGFAFDLSGGRATY